ncbi:hypothetical protein NE237_008270 [Protea cynaroides]|uniref:Uncharacterized protein n=1 Tax=Protea cynaroides TaxID=273540 RepID=A0A9Q0GLV5_9MAGN|nr:hypothetical protein NE237_008270 [Protea cynaroides]
MVSSTSGGGGTAFRVCPVTLRPDIILFCDWWCLKIIKIDTMARTKVPRVHDPLRFRSNEVEAWYADYARKKVEGGGMVNLVVGNYNDVEHGQELRITSYVKGVDISFNYRQLADLLGIPYDGPMVYCVPGEPQFVEMEMRAKIDNQLLCPDRWQMRACYLRPAPRVFCKIIQHNLIP